MCGCTTSAIRARNPSSDHGLLAIIPHSGQKHKDCAVYSYKKKCQVSDKHKLVHVHNRVKDSRD